MRCHEHRLSLLEVRDNMGIIVRQDTVQGCRKRLGKVVRELVVGITRVVGRMVLARLVYRGRGDIVTTTPDEDLVLTVFVYRFLFVQTLQGTVVTLVELPGLEGWDPHETSLFQNVPQGTNRALQERRVSYRDLDSFLLDELTGFNDLFVALGAEGTVIPAREFILQVPSGFAVTDQDKSVLVGSLDGGKACTGTGVIADRASCDSKSGRANDNGGVSVSWSNLGQVTKYPETGRRQCLLLLLFP